MFNIIFELNYVGDMHFGIQPNLVKTIKVRRQQKRDKQFNSSV